MSTSGDISWCSENKLNEDSATIYLMTCSAPDSVGHEVTKQSAIWGPKLVGERGYTSVSVVVVLAQPNMLRFSGKYANDETHLSLNAPRRQSTSSHR